MKYGYYYTGHYNKYSSKYMIKITLDKAEELKSLLEKYNVKYKVFDHEIINRYLVTFTLYDNHENFEYLYNKLNDLVISHNGCLSLNDKYIEFTKKELYDAKYLQMWVGKQIINVKDEEKTYEKTCLQNLTPKHPESGWYGFKHYHQIKPYTLKYEPKLNTKTAIYSIDTGFQAIFVDKRIKELIEKNRLRGFVFDKVYLKKEGIESENIFQLKTKNIINIDDFVFGNEMNEDICPMCGKISYSYSYPSAYQFHIKLYNLKENDDIYMSNRIFQGESYSIYIISQRFYRLLKENKLDGWLKFIPIIDASE